MTVCETVLTTVTAQHLISTRMEMATKSLHYLHADHPLLFILTGQYSSQVTPELGQLRNRHPSGTAVVRFLISHISP